MHRIARTTLALVVGLLLPLAARGQTLQLLYDFESGSGVTVPDASGNGRTGSLGTSSVFTSDAHEGIRAGETFATSQGINVAPFDLGNQFSVFTFVKLPDVTTASTIQTVFANSAAGFTTNGLRLFVDTILTTDRRIHLEAGDGTTGASVASAAGVYPADGQYHSLAFLIDRTAGTGTIFLDAAPVASGGGLPAFATNSGSQTLGIFAANSGSFPTNATFDDFRIYSGLLSAAQVRDLTVLPAAVPEPGVLAVLVAIGGAAAVWRVRARRRPRVSTT